jgi:hypothetical protein
VFSSVLGRLSVRARLADSFLLVVVANVVVAVWMAIQQQQGPRSLHSLTFPTSTPVPLPERVLSRNPTEVTHEEAW